MKKQKLLLIIILHMVFFCIYQLARAQESPAQNSVCGFKSLLDKQAISDSSVLQRLSKVNLTIEDAIREGGHKISQRYDVVIPVVVYNSAKVTHHLIRSYCKARLRRVVYPTLSYIKQTVRTSG